jgi:hypothetical protein
MPIKETAKTILLNVMPGGGELLRIAWQHRHMRRFEHRLGLDRLAQQFITRNGHSVLSGPFAGMIYNRQSVGSTLLPKLIGSYEEELHPTLAHIFDRGYNVIVDVGCAEGYYAVGLARKMPTARVYAFDIDPWGRSLCRKMAILNNVSDRVTVAGRCETDDLQRLLSDRALVVCDCEGFEIHLLQPKIVPALMTTDILVELHDHLQPGVTAELQARFAATHDFQLITGRERLRAEYSCLHFLSAEEQQLALSEFRVDQTWAFISARQPEAGAQTSGEGGTS